ADAGRTLLPAGEFRHIGQVINTLSSGPSALPPITEVTSPLSIDRPLQSPNWSLDFSERVAWVVRARVPSAQISLNPEHLGPVELSVEVEDQQARIQFTAANSITRDAIEQSLPRLREALEQQGLSLQQADVGDLRREQRESNSTAFESEESNQIASHDVTDDSESTGAVASQPVGLIDTYV
ncbi:MAG: flagellar hook-length control protein FliK, partial [Pseudomonadota bacterium]